MNALHHDAQPSPNPSTQTCGQTPLRSKSRLRPVAAEAGGEDQSTAEIWLRGKSSMFKPTPAFIPLGAGDAIDPEWTSLNGLCSAPCKGVSPSQPPPHGGGGENSAARNNMPLPTSPTHWGRSRFAPSPLVGGLGWGERRPQTSRCRIKRAILTRSAHRADAPVRYLVDGRSAPGASGAWSGVEHSGRLKRRATKGRVGNGARSQRATRPQRTVATRKIVYLD